MTNKTLLIDSRLKELFKKLNLSYEENYHYMDISNGEVVDYYFSYAIIDNMKPICFIDYCTTEVLRWYAKDLLTAKYIYHGMMEDVAFKIQTSILLISEDMNEEKAIKRIEENLKRILSVHVQK